MVQSVIRDGGQLVTMNDDAASVAEPGRPSVAARLNAWAFAPKFDRQVDAGMVPTPGSSLAAHVMRLTSVQERETIARSFRLVLGIGEQPRAIAQSQVAVLAGRINECRELIDDITLRLHSPLPVNAKGMARLRILLSDGAGPLYFHGSGCLAAELRAALAAL